MSKFKVFAAAFGGLAALFLFAHPALAQSLTLDLGGAKDAAAGGGADGSVAGRVIQMVALLTVLSVAPSILMMMTSFTRIVVVLSFLRTALGTQQTPPNTVLLSLALFLTFFIMTPTIQPLTIRVSSPSWKARLTRLKACRRR
jgi:flagellar biosynthetic protein FliP